MNNKGSKFTEKENYKLATKISLINKMENDKILTTKEAFRKRKKLVDGE